MIPRVWQINAFLARKPAKKVSFEVLSITIPKLLWIWVITLLKNYIKQEFSNSEGRKKEFAYAPRNVRAVRSKGEEWKSWRRMRKKEGLGRTEMSEEQKGRGRKSSERARINSLFSFFFFRSSSSLLQVMPFCTYIHSGKFVLSGHFPFIVVSSLLLPVWSRVEVPFLPLRKINVIWAFSRHESRENAVANASSNISSMKRKS